MGAFSRGDIIPLLYATCLPHSSGKWVDKVHRIKTSFLVLTDECYDGTRPRVARTSIVSETPFPNSFSDIQWKSHRVEAEITSFRKRN